MRSTLICSGYKGHPCGKIVKRTAYTQKRCKACAREEHKRHIVAWQVTHKKERTEYQRKWTEDHKAERKVYRRRYYKNHKAEEKERYLSRQEEFKEYRHRTRERTSVAGHHRRIFGTQTIQPCTNYKGMPFCDDWNPKKGGSYQAGADWIIANLGKKPEGCSLHVIDHAKGFVPGNLEWTYPVKQNAEKMFKIIARLKHQAKMLQEENINLKARVSVFEHNVSVAA